MNALDYYRKFLKCFNVKLIKGKELTNTSYNKYLYVYDNKLKGPKIITIIKNGLQPEYKYLSGAYAEYDTYMVYIPYKECMLMLELDVSQKYSNLYLRLYNDKNVFTYSYYDIQSIINFLELDKLDKLNQSINFLKTTLQIMYGIKIDIKVRKYKSEYKSLIEKHIDCFMHADDISSDTKYFNNNCYYLICSENKFYLNIHNNTYTFDKHMEGTYGGIIYFIKIDLERSIFIKLDRNSTNVHISCYKNNSIMFDTIEFKKFESLLRILLFLLNREDIYEHLKTINFFNIDIFYSDRLAHIF